MALTAAQAAARVHEALDDLAADFSTADDGTREIGDYTYPMEMALRDMGLSSVSLVTSQAEERALLLGMEYYAYLRLFRKYGSRASQQQGAGASGMHLSLDWSSTAKTLRMHVRDCESRYDDALEAIGRSRSGDPAADGTVSQVVVVDRDASDVDNRLLDTYDGMPWFVESEYDI